MSKITLNGKYAQVPVNYSYTDKFTYIPLIIRIILPLY